MKTEIKPAKITGKGQITVPGKSRKILGVEAGDRLLFERDASGVRVRSARSKPAFAKYRGIGNPKIGSGRAGIVRWLREMRDHEDRD